MGFGFVRHPGGYGAFAGSVGWTSEGDGRGWVLMGESSGGGLTGRRMDD